MNYSDFIERVSEEPEFNTKKAARQAVESTFRVLGKLLVGGQDVMISDFGKFGVVGRSARDGVNPRTGEKLRVQASKAVKFKASSTLKAKVNA